MNSQRTLVTASAVCLSLGLALFGAACGSKSKPKATTPETTPVTAPPAADKPAETAKENTPVSPSLNVSSDLAALCQLKRSDSVPPTFDYDKAELSPEDREVLQQIATCMTQGAAKGKTLTMTGRADPRGTEEYNMGLGAARARAVSVYLQRLGVPEAQLAETTRGSIDATGTNEETWRKDRRVDLDLGKT